MQETSTNLPKRLKTGRKTAYQPEYVQTAYQLTLLGKTIEQLAEFFNLNVRTLYQWRRKYPDFNQAIIDGSELADAQVAHALYNKAKGFETLEEKVLVVNNEVITKNVKRKHLPDTTAAEIWLRNRSRLWRQSRNGEEPQAPTTQNIQINVVNAIESLRGSNIGAALLQRLLPDNATYQAQALQPANTPIGQNSGSSTDSQPSGERAETPDKD